MNYNQSFSFILLIFVFSGDSLAEELDSVRINSVFSPILRSLAEKRYDEFGSWFRSHSLISEEIENQIQGTIIKHLVPKIPLYGTVIETRLLYNVVNEDKYGRVIFIQDYENLFILWRFDYYIKKNGDLSLKMFSMDNEIDLENLFNGTMKVDGVKFNIDKSEFIF